MVPGRGKGKPFVTLFLQAVVGGLSIGAIYALVAVGYNVVYASSGVFNLAQGQVLMVGVMLTYQFRALNGFAAPLAVALAAACCGALNVLIYLLAVHPMTRTRRHIALPTFVSTLGASIVIQNLVELHYGSLQQPFFQYFVVRGASLGGVIVTAQQVFMVGAALLIVFVYYLFIERTRWGSGLSAMSEDHEAASLRGVPVGRGRALSFFLAGVISGLAGAVIGPVTLADPTLGFTFALKGFVAMAIGGFGSSTGALAGGAVLGTSEELFTTYGNDEYAIFASLGLLLVVFILRPRGLLGRLAVREV